MSTVFTLIVVLGLIGAATFLVGFTKGVREAVSEYRNPQPEGAWSDEGHYGLSALFAVVASAVVIALVGVAPAWIYAGRCSPSSPRPALASHFWSATSVRPPSLRRKPEAPHAADRPRSDWS